MSVSVETTLDMAFILSVTRRLSSPASFASTSAMMSKRPKMPSTLLIPGSFAISSLMVFSTLKYSPAPTFIMTYALIIF